MNALTTALTTIRRSPYQALVSILMVSVTFFVVYSFSYFVGGAHKILQYFETQPQIIAFFELQTPTEAITQLKQIMEAKPYVESVKIVSQEDALKMYQEENKADPLLLELVTADILPASIEVAGNDLQALQSIKQDLDTAQNVEDVVYQQDIIETLSSWTRSVRIIGVGAIITLATISFLIIMVVIAIKAAHKRRTISIMRIIGATQWYIKAPFLLEGMVYGAIGSLIGFIVAAGVLLYSTPWIKAFLGDIQVFPVPLTFFLAQAVIGTIAGSLLGGSAGFLAVQRLIKR
jgi:cell division transport system permease protein